MNTHFFIGLALLAATMGFATQVSTPEASNEAATLREAAENRGFVIGAAVDINALQNDPQYAEVLAQQYNIVVPENVMKWDATEPQQGRFTFADGDKLVDFAEAHGMQVRGHNLVWHEALPDWVTSQAYTRDQLLDILCAHIKGVASHYAGRIRDWDVVNEAVADGESGTLRHDLWLDTIGPDYIEQAFRCAHDADPNAKLFYNDYAAEGMNAKSDGVYKLVSDLKAKGVPIDGVGLQMHIGIGPDEAPAPDEVAANMARLAALGLEVQITEMDVKTQTGTGSEAERLDAQAALYGDMLRVCLEQEACTAFLSWGFTDNYSWIPWFTGKDDAPLPFDKAYQPKPAWHAMMDVLSVAE